MRIINVIALVLLLFSLVGCKNIVNSLVLSDLSQTAISSTGLDTTGSKDNRIILMKQEDYGSIRYYSPDSKNYISYHYLADMGDKPEVSIYLNDTVLLKNGYITSNGSEMNKMKSVWLDNERVIISGDEIYNITDKSAEAINYKILEKNHPEADEETDAELHGITLEKKFVIDSFDINSSKDKIAYTFLKYNYKMIYVYDITNEKWTSLWSKKLNENAIYYDEGTSVQWDLNGNLYFGYIVDTEVTKTLRWEKDSNTFIDVPYDDIWSMSPSRNYCVYARQSDEKTVIRELSKNIDIKEINDISQFVWVKNDQIAYYQPSSNGIILYDLKSNRIISEYDLTYYLSNGKSFKSIQYYKDQCVFIILDYENNIFSYYKIDI